MGWVKALVLIHFSLSILRAVLLSPMSIGGVKNFDSSAPSPGLGNVQACQGIRGELMKCLTQRAGKFLSL